ncbi:MAG: RNA-binding protein [Solirubrobacterales bacterium]
MLPDELIGRLVISKSGRDEGKPFAVLKVLNDRFVIVADGDLRKVENPKMKNIRHIQVTNRGIPEIVELMKSGGTIENHKLRKIIRGMWSDYQEDTGKEVPAE